MNPNFNFLLEVRAPQGLFAIWLRFCARQIATMLANSSDQTFQFGGYDGTLNHNYLLVNADKYQVIHWILTVAGYSCTPAKVMQRCGINPDAKPAPAGTLTVIQENPVVESVELPPSKPRSLTAWFYVTRMPWIRKFP